MGVFRQPPLNQQQTFYPKLTASSAFEDIYVAADPPDPGVGTAFNASILVAPNAGVSTGTGAAYDADIPAIAEVATGSGTAFGGFAHVKPNAAVSSGTGAAYDAEVPSVDAVPATGTGSAANASVRVSPRAGVATGTGAANLAFGNNTFAFAVAVPVTGAAYNATTVHTFPPGWRPGDIAIVIFGVNNTGPPGEPAGWTQIGTASGSAGGSGNSIAGTAAYRVLQTGDTDVGVWTLSASSPDWGASLAIYRGQHDTTPIGTTSGLTLVAGDVVTWAGIGATAASSSWVLAGLIANDNINQSLVPAGTIFREGINHGDAVAIFDTNSGVSSWPSDSETYASVGLHGRWTIELRAATAITFITSLSASDVDRPATFDLPPMGSGPLTLEGSAAGTSDGLGRLNYKGLFGQSTYGDSYELDDPISEPWATGNLTLQIALQGTSAGTSPSIGQLQGVPKDLQGTSAGTSTATGNLGVAFGLQGTSAGTSTCVGNITGQWALHGLAEGSSFCQGLLVVINDTDWGVFPPPNVPPERVVFIRYRGHDITRRVMYSSTIFKTSARGNAGACVIRVRDDNQQFEFVTGGSITLDVGDTRHWGGYLASVKRGFFFEGSHDAPGDIVRYIELRGLDYNILLSKRVLYDRANFTNMQLTTYQPGTPDDEIIKYYADHHLDLHNDGLDTDTLVEHVGTPSMDDEISGAAGWQWSSLLRMLRFNTGAIDYIDPDKNLVHTDVDTPNAPFGISDDPDETEVGCRDLVMDFDAAKLRNDALIWGMGQGSENVVFSRSTDEDSIEEHGLWQIGQSQTAVWRQATIDHIAESWVYGSPQSKRGGKDDRTAVECVVFEPVFRVAQKVAFRSAVFDFEDVIPIRDIEIDFPTPWHPRFKLTLSHEIDDPWNTYEFWFPDYTIPDVDIQLPGVPSFTDPDGNPIATDQEPESCNNGIYSYDTTGSGSDLLAQGIVKVDMLYSRQTIPPDMAQPNHPSGKGFYLIDGAGGTGLEGYRLSSKEDAIVWSSDVPLVISGVTIQQGMTYSSGDNDGPGRHRSCWAQCFVGTLPNGSNKVLKGTWGELLPTIRGETPNRTDPGGGEATIGISFGLGDPSVAGGSGVFLGGVKYVEVKSKQGWWFKGTGLYDFGGRWRVSEASLFMHCISTALPDPDGNLEGGSGGAFFPGSEPEGGDPDAVYFYTQSSWLENTLLVYVDGLLAQPFVDYESNSDEMWIKFPQGFNGDVYIRYYPR